MVCKKTESVRRTEYTVKTVRVSDDIKVSHLPLWVTYGPVGETITLGGQKVKTNIT